MDRHVAHVDRDVDHDGGAVKIQLGLQNGTPRLPSHSLLFLRAWAQSRTSAVHHGLRRARTDPRPRTIPVRTAFLLQARAHGRRRTFQACDRQPQRQLLLPVPSAASVRRSWRRGTPPWPETHPGAWPARTGSPRGARLASGVWPPGGWHCTPDTDVA
jgi:hypothetical protein